MSCPGPNWVKQSLPSSYASPSVTPAEAEAWRSTVRQLAEATVEAAMSPTFTLKYGQATVLNTALFLGALGCGVR